MPRPLLKGCLNILILFAPFIGWNAVALARVEIDRGLSWPTPQYFYDRWMNCFTIRKGITGLIRVDIRP
jgi:hypothetical protein